jgi:hypothetical protein
MSGYIVPNVRANSIGGRVCDEIIVYFFKEEFKNTRFEVIHAVLVVVGRAPPLLYIIDGVWGKDDDEILILSFCLFEFIRSFCAKAGEISID